MNSDVLRHICRMTTMRYGLCLLLLIGAICAKSQEQRLRRGRVGTERLFERLSDRRHSSILSLVPWCDKLIAYGMEDVLVSSDSGRTWTPLAAELPQRTVSAVRIHGDTITTLAPAGTINQSTNWGLSWTRHRSAAGSQQNVLVPTDTGWTSVSDLDVYRTTQSGNETFALRDSMAIIRTVSGAAIIYADARIADASCIAGSYRHIFVGLGRSGILTIDRIEKTSFVAPTDMLNGEFVRTVCVMNDMLYAGVSSGATGIYRRPEYSTTWSIIPFDQLADPVDPLCLTPTNEGVFVGMREQGVGFISHTRTNGESLHLGLTNAGVTSVEPFIDGLLIGSTLRGPCIVPSCSSSVRSLARALPTCLSSTICVVDSTLFLGCHDGWIYRSRDTARTWERIAQPVGSSEITKLQVVDSTLYLSTMHGLWRSQDMGTSWNAVHSDLRDYNVNTVVPADSTMVILTTTGTLVLDKQDVVTSAELPTGFEFRPFINAAVHRDGVLYAAGYPTASISLDGGRSWKSYLSEEMMTTRVAASVGPYLYMLNVDGFLYRIRFEELRRKLTP
ncbi:MAG: Photosynthesis system assembly factor [Bacteroidota bacterium]